MRVHRSAHVRNFTVLPNAVLQYRRLSYTARGLLADLLSRPDGWREDGRHMADTSPQGRGAIRKALKELTEAGFYRVEKIRMSDGTIRTETHVYDTPQLALPGATRPVSGEATTSDADAPVVKNRYQEPTLPAGQVDGQPAADEASEEPGGREEDRPDAVDAPAMPDEQVCEAVATLFRVIRPEPRLHLGEAEARTLAPLVAQWLDRGATQADLAHALLPGLPTPVHAAVAVLRSRLGRKMPPPVRPARPAYAECAVCRDPVPQPGMCRPCAGHSPRAAGRVSGARIATQGAARARAAMNAARTALEGRSLVQAATV
ncbi:hypothetical protein RMN57_22960 [Kitasatospora sp. CM 4170]|uniref:Helix-turn-helix domain-containing protein n=1 Tax=Kitasatospora aburaviensis TaxID=67265 RepID=A0ABW1F007_9ACTN|nr:hypothetical protein [Kitasatospora sp. CM 4170]WNM47353.1 hypothetical protein RMN57_22960 [Kitasatospora sp. CM 4170]